jgi:hypothetical protein
VLATAALHVSFAALTTAVDSARRDSQMCRYGELIRHLPRLLAELNAACRSLDGDARRRVSALSADAYHVAAAPHPAMRPEPHLIGAWRPADAAAGGILRSHAPASAGHRHQGRPADTRPLAAKPDRAVHPRHQGAQQARRRPHVRSSLGLTSRRAEPRRRNPQARPSDHGESQLQPKLQPRDSHRTLTRPKPGRIVPGQTHISNVGRVGIEPTTGGL